jgi:hypothetical protein
MDIGDHRVAGTQGDSKASAAVRVAVSGMVPRELFQGDAPAPARRSGSTPSIRLTRGASHVMSSDD